MSSEYTPEDDAALSAALDLGYRRGRPSPVDEQLEEEDDARRYLRTLPEDDVE